MFASKHSLLAWLPLSALAFVLSGPSQSVDTDVNPQAPERRARLIPPAHSFGALTADQIRDSVGLAAADVVSISSGTSDAAGSAIFTTAVGTLPNQGTSYYVMSTGNTSSALTPNNAPDTSTELRGLNNSQGRDMVQTVFTLHPPAGATCFAFDFVFFSEEFPEYVGSKYNDAFIAEIGQSTFQIVGNQVVAPNNFAFDTANHVISINTTFGATAGNAAGTTYDGATPFLTAVTPLESPGSDITVTLSIMDLGDSIYDSTVFVDNMRWFFGLSCVPGADADSDGDALLDDWETNGIDFDNNGTVDLDLPAFGADPMHKDIFVEIDYMVLAGAGGHSHEPKAAALQAVIATFANAPVMNPDMTTGIRIHIDAGANTIMNPVTNTTWGTRTRSNVLTHQTNLGTMSGNNYNWSAFDTLKGVGMAGNFEVQRADVFHYCIFGHSLAASLTTTSGISRGIPASDFLVTLGGWTDDVGSVNEQAGTFIHELGHGLGLKHGGNDHGNFKPNYLSVMNYFFQTRGLRFNGADGLFDYSRFQLPILDESNLNETLGISGVAAAANYGTRFFDPTGMRRIANDVNVAIDWNQDGDATDNPAMVNLNDTGTCTTGGAFCNPSQANCAAGNGPCNQTLTALGNSNNWAEIRFDGGAVGHLGEMIVLPLETEPMDIDQPTDGLIPTDYKVGVVGPAKLSLAACAPTTLAYTITNLGLYSDVFAISVSQTLSWGDTSAIPASVALNAGASVSYDVPVLVPQGTVNGTVDEIDVNVHSTSNPLMKDSASTDITAFSVDSDGDGLTDECDACPNSILTATIVIDGCDSHVPNTFFPDGCTMSDLIWECHLAATNHGAFVSCVSHLTNGWKSAGLISGAQKGAIQSCAAHSSW
jgi:hypothetical protein